MRTVLGLVLVLVAGWYATGPTAAAPASARPVPWLAYQGLAPDFSDALFLVRADGSGDHQIFEELPGSARHPDFSRDGQRLAFDLLPLEPSEMGRVYVAGADGRRVEAVRECAVPECTGHGEPAWSPGGRRIAVAADIGGPVGVPPLHHGVAIIDLSRGTERAIVEHPAKDGQDHFPRWSPDGRWIVFWRGREQPGGVQTAVFLVRADGAGLRQLTPWDMLARDPDWSPDGSRILFNTRPLLEFQQGGQSELHTIRRDGRGVRRLTAYGPNGPRATHPRWTPDGRAIVYVRTNQDGFPRHIYAISSEGRHDTPLLTAKSIYTHPVVRAH